MLVSPFVSRVPSRAPIAARAALRAVTALAALLAAACADRLTATPSDTPDVAPARSALTPQGPSFGVVAADGSYWDGFDFLFSTPGFGTPGGPAWPNHLPTAWKPTDFDVAMHSREPSTWYTPEPFRGMHGTNCAPFQNPEPVNDVRPGDTGSHDVTTYDDMNYRCRNHMMTALKATGYGSIYVTPNALVDFTNGEASIKFAMSTLRTSANDWIDLWITPYDDNLVHPIDMQLAFSTDLQGVPRTAIHIRMVPGQINKSRFEAYWVNNYAEGLLGVINTNGYEKILKPVSTRRDTFELRISRTRTRFGMKKVTSPNEPAASIDWIDVNLGIPWTRGVVQFGHHSMNPTAGGGTPGTWHWDDYKIAPAIPFTIIPTKLTGATRQRFVDSATAGTPVEFERAAPANAFLRFAAIGTGIQFSTDGGATWTDARVQRATLNITSRFRSYWTPIPEGTTAVLFRNTAAPTQQWFVRDLAIWSLTQ